VLRQLLFDGFQRAGPSSARSIRNAPSAPNRTEGVVANPPGVPLVLDKLVKEQWHPTSRPQGATLQSNVRCSNRSLLAPGPHGSRRGLSSYAPSVACLRFELVWNNEGLRPWLLTVAPSELGR
jgi:hypothetical protein